MAAVGLFSIAAAWMLAWLPGMDQAGGGSDSVPVIGKESPVRLLDGNLVDGIAGLPLTLRIRKLDLDQSVLKIDLGADARKGEAPVYHDLVEVSRFALEGTSNISQVLVRVMEEKPGTAGKSGSLLVALDARREDRKESGNKLAKEAGPEKMLTFLQGQYRLSITQRWQERLVEIAREHAD